MRGHGNLFPGTSVTTITIAIAITTAVAATAVAAAPDKTPASILLDYTPQPMCGIHDTTAKLQVSNHTYFLNKYYYYNYRGCQFSPRCSSSVHHVFISAALCRRVRTFSV